MRKLILLVMFCISAALSAEPYEHDKWLTQSRDIFFKFEAFVVSFDGPDDDDGDGKPDLWGIPEFVSYEIRRTEKKYKLPKRPGWTTDKNLFKAGIAPDDKTYAVPGTRKIPEVKTDFRTHTLLNSCPQLQSQNNGIWKELEQKCEALADQYGKVWVICGPVFFNKTPSMWLGSNTEKKTAIPDAFFKIIIWQEDDKVIHQAYLIPNILVKPKPLKFYLTTIPRIQSLTGLKFLTKTKIKTSPVMPVFRYNRTFLFFINVT